MSRRQGFYTEDYELCEEINIATEGRLRPSEACDIAERWALTKMRKRGKQMWDLGYHDQARAIYNTCALIESGEL